jgi:prefoldin alpha subunit
MDDTALRLHTQEQQVRSLQKQNEHLQQQRADLLYTIQSVEDFQEIAVGTEFLAPMGNGIFVKGKVSANDSFVVNVGAGTCVAKTPHDLKTLLSTQLAELNNVSEKIAEEITKISVALQSVKGK